MDNNAAIALIKQFEGCRLTAYQDQGGVWTIGYGTTGPGIVEGLTINQATANAMLTSHVAEITQSIKALTGPYLSANQLNAVTSFVYNVGIGAFKGSTMLKCILNRDMASAAQEFPKWDHINGVVSEGLLNRRLAEQALFLS